MVESKESSRDAPGGGMSSALILRLAPTLSPTNEPKLWRRVNLEIQVR